ncbi:protein eva-1 homolog C isoform X2 [Amia ocellicauda]|uniref:protein eva-1 homolog C isoform X2 n=1 Tax=Amia ocellicauda TaxID=2972642 RepID=UPI003464CB78
MNSFDGGMLRHKGCFLSLCYYILLLWTKEIDALADFSGYLSRIIKSHSAHACDGERLRLHCPRHSTISVLSAFYGHSELQLCPSHSHYAMTSGNRSCSKSTALQKIVSECQGFRDCKLPVNNRVFGCDPCPGTTKYVLVSYKCKPTEHKTKVGCEGEVIKLQCKHPRVINIYSAVYGRGLEDDNHCSLVGKPTVFVPWTVLTEADPSVLNPTSDPEQNEVILKPKGSRRPNSGSIIVSNSLVTYAYIKEHPETAALLFVSSVCLGLLCTLCALAVRVSCSGDSGSRSPGESPRKEGAGEEDEEDSDHKSSTGSSLRKSQYPGEIPDVSEAADLAERIERREQILLEIWMNTCQNGTSDFN